MSNPRLGAGYPAPNHNFYQSLLVIYFINAFAWRLSEIEARPVVFEFLDFFLQTIGQIKASQLY